MRTIAHLDADAFYVSVEILRRPELAGQPVVVAGTGPRAVVTTASYEARKFGVGSAVPAARARRLCPDAIFIPPDFAHYREVSARMMGILRAHAPVVEVVGLDEAYLDLTDMVAPRAAMRRLVADVHSATGLTCSVGIGPNKLVTTLASDADKPQRCLSLTREEACARFASAPVTLVPGIGERTAQRLAQLGIRALGELGRASEEELCSRFGPRQGGWLIRRARFEDEGTVQPVREPVSESRETTFPRDVADGAELERVLAELTEQLCAGLRRQNRRGRTVGIKVRLDDFSTHTRAKTLPAAVNETERVGEVARDLLRDFAPSRPVRLLGVRVAGLDGAAIDAGQLELPV